MCTDQYVNAPSLSVCMIGNWSVHMYMSSVKPTCNSFPAEGGEGGRGGGRGIEGMTSSVVDLQPSREDTLLTPTCTVSG